LAEVQAFRYPKGVLLHSGLWGFAFGRGPVLYPSESSTLCQRRRQPLQRLFSTFPGGGPGAGLLLLRSAAGVAAVVEGGAYLADGGGSVGCGVVAVASGLSLLVGFLTPLASAVIAAGTTAVALAWVPPPTIHVLRDSPTTAFVVIVAAAIMLLGPGAFSLDSYLFGRREIVIPHDSRAQRAARECE
jgi:hypothetical protein